MQESHLRKLWDLNQSLEILQVTGAIEQTLQPGEREKRSERKDRERVRNDKKIK